jgi:ornithine carbamoyltransferase
MNSDEFESQTRESLETALNQLQAAMLLLSSLESQILESGNTIKELGRTIETYITSQQNGVEVSARSQL